MRFHGRMAILLYVCLSAYGQEGSTVNMTEGPPYKAWTSLSFYVPATTNVEYICTAGSPQAAFYWRISDSTLASIDDVANTSTVSTATAHGLQVGNAVTVSGASDADLNGTYYVQTVGATTFTITTANVTDATYTDAALAISSTAPRTSAAIWSLQKMRYDGAGNLSSKQWAGGVPAAKWICDNRAVTTGTTKVTFQ